MTSNIPSGLSMYFKQELVKKFSALEQNEKNFQVSEIVDLLIQQEFENQKLQKVAELGGGAHPDRYDWLFSHLINHKGHVDWVDVSKYMLDEAIKYIDLNKLDNRKSIITFIQTDIISYLNNQADEAIDLFIMKYTIDHIQDIDTLFSLFDQKLKKGGKVIATIGVLNPNLKSISTNARFLYNGQEFPENETRTLKDGNTFTVKFFNESGHPEKGYLDGAETTKYYHSPEKLKKSATNAKLSIFLGDWKQYYAGDSTITLDQDIMILTKD